MLDLDGFKAVNDRFGHVAGRHRARGGRGAARGSLRESDVPARYGGDEFAVILPGITKTEAYVVAEKLRERHRGAPVTIGDGEGDDVPVSGVARRGVGGPRDRPRPWRCSRRRTARCTRRRRAVATRSGWPPARRRAPCTRRSSGRPRATASTAGCVLTRAGSPRAAAGGAACGRTSTDASMALTYGLVSSLAVDPIEKKPVFHYRPGSRVLSLGSVGCSMRCGHCQNWQISRPAPDDKSRLAARTWRPTALVDIGRGGGLPGHRLHVQRARHLGRVRRSTSSTLATSEGSSRSWSRTATSPRPGLDFLGERDRRLARRRQGRTPTRPFRRLCKVAPPRVGARDGGRARSALGHARRGASRTSCPRSTTTTSELTAIADGSPPSSAPTRPGTSRGSCRTSSSPTSTPRRSHAQARAGDRPGGGTALRLPRQRLRPGRRGHRLPRVRRASPCSGTGYSRAHRRRRGWCLHRRAGAPWASWTGMTDVAERRSRPYGPDRRYPRVLVFFDYA